MVSFTTATFATVTPGTEPGGSPSSTISTLMLACAVSGLGQSVVKPVPVSVIGTDDSCSPRSTDILDKVTGSNDGEADSDGLMDADGLSVGDSDADGLIDADGLMDADGLIDGESELDGLGDNDTELDGLVDGDGALD